MRQARAIWWTIGIAWLLVVLRLTLQSAPDQASRIAELPWYCILCGDGGVADVILNLVLFAPLGVAARALRLPRAGAFALAVALTVAIETAQALVLVGRDGSLGDVLSNSAGAALGWLAYPALLRLGQPSRRFARAGVAGTLVLSAMIWFATGVALRPEFSLTPQWVGQLQHQWPAHDAFPGKIDAATINGVTIPNDPLDAPSSLRDSVVLRVALTRALALPPRPASLVRIVDGNGHPQISLTEVGSDLRAEVQLHASQWGFHTPDWNFRAAMTAPLRIRWQVAAQWTRDSVTLTTATEGGVERATYSHPLSIALGWAFIHPFVRTLDANAQFWNYVWLGWWFGLLGWLAGALSWRAVAAAGATQLSTLLLAATLTGAPWHADELIVALAACGMCAVAARLRAGPDPTGRDSINSE